jgi:hypothetical protein
MERAFLVEEMKRVGLIPSYDDQEPTFIKYKKKQKSHNRVNVAPPLRFGTYPSPLQATDTKVVF